MVDAIVVGAGPAGSVAALTLARAGARVLVVDRVEFPRDVLCGDLLSPRALQSLADLGLDLFAAHHPHLLRGWRLVLPHVSPREVVGSGVARGPAALARRVLDAWLLDEAIRAGARFESGWHVRRALIDDATGIVRGVVMRRRGRSQDMRMPAHVVIAADGRHSGLSHHCGLRRRAVRRQRIGRMYATGIDGIADLGEIHVGARAYCGMTPMGGGLVNVWLVPHVSRRGASVRSIADCLSDQPSVRGRLEGARFDGGRRWSVVRVSEPRSVGVPGMLLAGDAAGAVDPVGDGVYQAIVGGQLAADQAIRALESGDFTAALDRLAAAREVRLGAIHRAARVRERWLRRPWAVHAAGLGSLVAPRWLCRILLHDPFT